MQEIVAVYKKGKGHFLFGGHKWNYVEYAVQNTILDELGLVDYEELDSFTARYRFVLECKCSEIAVIESVGYI